MPRELVDAQITHVSYVDKAANKKRFFLTKSQDGQPTFDKEVRILVKADDPQKLVYGVVYEPDAVDTQGDFMVADEIEKAAHMFLSEYRNIDKQHNFEGGYGDVVESYVAPEDLAIGDQIITKGSWVLVTRATDEIWEGIQKGEITGYSMGGTAKTVEKAEETEEAEMKGFFKALKAFFSPNVAKGEVMDRFKETQRNRDFWGALDIFEGAIFNEYWRDKPDMEKIRSAIQDFGDLLAQILASPDIAKAMGPIPEDKKVKKEDIEMTKEEMQELLKAELSPLVGRVEALEKAEGTEETAPAAATEGATEPEAQPTTEQLVETFKSVLGEAIAPLTQRLDAVEKARNISKAGEGEQAPAQTQNIWAGLL